MSLPRSGPGRPHHPSYTEPGPQASLLELFLLIVGLAVVGYSAVGVWGFVERVLGA